MGWFSYNCETHGAFKKTLDRREEVADCPVCGKPAKAVLRAGTLRVVEQLDNGAMARKVERLHNIEEIMDERNKKYSIKQDDEL